MTLLALFVSLFGLVLFRVSKGRESFARANLLGGRVRDWILYGGAIVLFLALQTALNALFSLGKPIDPNSLVPPGVNLPGETVAALLGFQTIVLGSLIGLVIAFGEEYGWRVYLQGQLTRLGKKRGVLMVGLIWGAWHYPMIWMGYNYPGQPVAGTIMMTILCVLFAYVLGYAMLKTGSIWLVAFIHAVMDQTGAFFAAVINAPINPVLSFGIGLPGLAMLAAIVFLLLRDPVWHDTPSDSVLPQRANIQTQTVR